ncbi:MAG: NUDIX hydrolase [Synergistales bacterium]|nr:NUDIX hydrolase [Synergistales bacterium]
MRIRVAGMIAEQGAYLLLRYRYPKGLVYGIPGGNLDENESLLDALRRELQEELGIVAEVRSLIFAAEEQAHHGLPRTVHLGFSCSLQSGRPAVNPRQTSAEGCEWLSAEALRSKTLYPNVASALNDREPLFPSLYLGILPQRPWM